MGESVGVSAYWRIGVSTCRRVGVSAYWMVLLVLLVVSDRFEDEDECDVAPLNT
jgi:hypothetical protein